MYKFLCIHKFSILLGIYIYIYISRSGIIGSHDNSNMFKLLRN